MQNLQVHLLFVRVQNATYQRLISSQTTQEASDRFGHSFRGDRGGQRD